MLARSEARRRVAEFLSSTGWKESGQPYERFTEGAEDDYHERFAVRLGGSVPLVNETQRPEIGMMVRTVVSVRAGYELRSPPHTVEDSDTADDAVHALMKAVSAHRHSPGLELVHVSIDPPITDSAEGRWWLGGFQIAAFHRFALE